MKIKLYKTILPIIIITFLISNVAKADEASKYDELKEQITPLIEELAKKVPESSISDCETSLDPLFQMETILFIQFLDTHYSNKASTSSLNDIAIMRFYEYKKKLNYYLNNLSPKTGELIDRNNIIEEYDKYRVCEGLSTAYVQVAKNKMFEHVRTNVYVKKSTMVAESLIPINEEMRELLFSFTKMYSYFLTFKDKLPGFLSDCITK